MIATVRSPLASCLLSLGASTSAFGTGHDQDIAAELNALVDEAARDAHLPSVVVAVVSGPDLVYSRAVGFADPVDEVPATIRTLYRIGSLTKVFTSTLMVQLRDEGVLRLDDPVEQYLPEGVRLPTDPRGAPAITFRHLSQHASGLPERPIDVEGGERYFWDTYTAERLYDGLSRTRLIHPIDADVQYSNLGMGLLGHVLSLAAEVPYEDLLHERLFEPLGMADSVLATAAELEGRLARGCLPGPAHEPAPPWELGVLEGCGGIVCHAEDLARFLSLQFRAGSSDCDVVAGASLAELHRPQWILNGWNQALGLGWIIDRTDDLGPVPRHNGGMAGFRSHMSFSWAPRIGVLVLTNSGVGPGGGGAAVADLGRALLRRSIEPFGRVAAPVETLARSLPHYFGTQDDEELLELFDPGFLENIPRQAVLDAFSDEFRQRGRCEDLVSIEPLDTPWKAKLTLRFEDESVLRCELHTDAFPPYRILLLRMN